MDVAANPVVKSFLAGSFSGTCSTILFQPLDLVKTRIQSQVAIPAVSAATGGGGSVVLNGTAVTSTPTSMFSVAKHVLKNEHVSGLWRGILPSITRTVPGVGLYFSSLHWLKSKTTGEKPSALEAIGLGMVARSFAGAVMIPITVIKTRFESGSYRYSGMSSALVTIYSKEGLRGLSCGLIPTLVRDAPYSGLYLMFYTQLKQHVGGKVLERHAVAGDANAAGLAAAVHFACGTAAGFLASAVTHPADVVKTQMQLHPARYGGSAANACLAILRASGPRGFMVGLAPRMLRRTLMSALAWTVYEEIMRKVGLK